MMVVSKTQHLAGRGTSFKFSEPQEHEDAFRASYDVEDATEFFTVDRKTKIGHRLMGQLHLNPGFEFLKTDDVL